MEQTTYALCVGSDLLEFSWLRWALLESELEIVTARHGEAALDRVAARPPAVVLVHTGVEAPDGFEVCRRITEESETRYLPVFMVASTASDQARRLALESGAEGLLAPPASREEVAARLRVALRRERAQQSAEHRLDELREVIGARDGLVDLALQDLDAMLGAARQALVVVVENSGEAASTAARRHAAVIWRELQAAEETIRTLRVIRAIEDGRWSFGPAACSLSEVMDEVLEASEGTAGPRGVRLQAAVEPGLELTADAGLLVHALTAMVSHVVSRVRGAGEIEVSATAGDREVCLAVRASGRVVPPHPATDPVNAALQVTLSRMVADAHGGRLELSAEQPARLALALPETVPQSAPWPPSSVSMDGPEGAARGSSAGAEAADMLAARTALPAPERPPRLMPPMPD